MSSSGVALPIVIAEPTPRAFVSDWRHLLQIIVATARLSWKQSMAYLINIIRWPLHPFVTFCMAYLAYSAAGQSSVAGVSVSGFLLVGLLGEITVTSAVWWMGSVIEEDRWEGTIAAVFISPASREAVLLGHGIGGLAAQTPAFLALIVIGFATGAQFDVASVAAVVASTLALTLSSLAMGFVLASVFVLTRRANLAANVIQHPLYLLGGFIVARERFPRWLHVISDLVPISHATDALRASTLSGASLSTVSSALLVSTGLAAIYIAIGFVGLKKVERAAKRAGQLDLY